MHMYLLLALETQFPVAVRTQHIVVLTVTNYALRAVLVKRTHSSTYYQDTWCMFEHAILDTLGYVHIGILSSYTEDIFIS